MDALLRCTQSQRSRLGKLERTAEFAEGDVRVSCSMGNSFLRYVMGKCAKKKIEMGFSSINTIHHGHEKKERK